MIIRGVGWIDHREKGQRCVIDDVRGFVWISTLSAKKMESVRTSGSMTTTVRKGIGIWQHKQESIRSFAASQRIHKVQPRMSLSDRTCPPTRAHNTRIVCKRGTPLNHDVRVELTVHSLWRGPWRLRTLRSLSLPVSRLPPKSNFLWVSLLPPIFPFFCMHRKNLSTNEINEANEFSTGSNVGVK